MPAMTIDVERALERVRKALAKSERQRKQADASIMAARWYSMDGENYLSTFDLLTLCDAAAVPQEGE